MPNYLYDALKEYTLAEETNESRRYEESVYPLHMPGHKRRLGHLCDPFAIDITEIDGFDNLHHAEDILKEAQERAARLYESEETHFLVNGSTGGILTAVSAAVTAGRQKGRGGLLMARNCHKAAYHAAYLCGVDPVWLWPQSSDVPGNREAGAYLGGRIRPEDVEEALRSHPECGTVLIVSPTYDGVLSDIGKIARIVHRYRGVLIVDEAHGAHYGLHETLPLSSVQQGADLVIHSLHKTLPSLTQTALLHVNGPYADRALVHRFLQIYQTSSPSYVLMASMDECIRQLEMHVDSWFPDFMQMLDRFYDSVRDLRVLRVLRPDDPSKIVILPGEAAGNILPYLPQAADETRKLPEEREGSVPSANRQAGSAVLTLPEEGRLSGRNICDILRTIYRLEPEMAVPAYVLALTSIGDDEEGLIRLSGALREIDEACYIRNRFVSKTRTGQKIPTETGMLPEQLPMNAGREPERAMSLRDAWDAPRKAVPVERSAGRIAGEPVYLYPPGIPMVVPGERITAEQAEWMSRCKDAGYELQGMDDLSGKQILVVEEL